MTYVNKLIKHRNKDASLQRIETTAACKMLDFVNCGLQCLQFDRWVDLVAKTKEVLC